MLPYLRIGHRKTPMKIFKAIIHWLKGEHKPPNVARTAGPPVYDPNDNEEVIRGLKDLRTFCSAQYCEPGNKVIKEAWAAHINVLTKALRIIEEAP